MYDKENMNTQKNKKPWHKNAGNFIVSTSISAAISILVIGLLFQGSCVVRKIDYLFDIAISLNVIALLIFIITAEAIAMAVEEDDVNKYIAYMLPYDIGVICLTISLDLVLYQTYISWTCWGVVIAVSLLFCVPWVKWIHWLLFSKPHEFDKYKSELEGNPLPESGPKLELEWDLEWEPEREPEWDWEKKWFSYTGIFYKCRKSQRKVAMVAALCRLLGQAAIFYWLSRT